jgi:hypothetical protein
MPGSKLDEVKKAIQDAISKGCVSTPWSTKTTTTGQWTSFTVTCDSKKDAQDLNDVLSKIVSEDNITMRVAYVLNVHVPPD